MSTQQASPLQPDSIKWAIDCINRHSDGDIFPKIPEISAVADNPDPLISTLSSQAVGNFKPLPCRRFIVPKGDLSYRQATQLHPQDSILLTAIMYEHGETIENHRLPTDKVFTYRFSPEATHGLYGDKNLWNAFWTQARDLSFSHPFILYLDIADFYNQIYHHTVENQLAQCGLPNQSIKWIRELLENTTQGVSRGIPIGPHGIHLIAESTLIPIDNSLVTKDVEFIRYADDFVIACESETEARKLVYDIATTLDKQQRLILQQHKTKISGAKDFQEFCSNMIEDRPISDGEAELLAIIRKYDYGNPYATLTFNQILPEDWKRFETNVVSDIVQEYLSQQPVDYIRLRWFFLRLVQVGHPGALEVLINEFSQLEPCLSSVCFYIAAIQSIPAAKWQKIGEKMLDILDQSLIMDTEFARLSILSLFSKNQHIDHFNRLSERFERSDADTRRQILFAAMVNGNVDWLREQKEAFASMDPWQQMAFIYCSSIFPRDEKRHFLRRVEDTNPFTDQLLQWAKDRE